MLLIDKTTRNVKQTEEGFAFKKPWSYWSWIDNEGKHGYNTH